MFSFIIVYSRYADAEIPKNMSRRNGYLEKNAIKRIIGGHDSSESERNYCVQGKEELMLVIIEGSE